ncbi:MAG: hypothetical protein WKF30_17000, partial [Pyrinomonadaceae bacterium]
MSDKRPFSFIQVMKRSSSDILLLLLLSAFVALTINFINLHLIQKDNPQNAPINNQHTVQGVMVDSVDNECFTALEG